MESKRYLVETQQMNPWHNLALEEALSLRVRPGEVWLYLWVNDRTVVIGKGQNALRECNLSLLEEEGGFLARRTTGGGAVYHDKGNLCFSFLCSPESYDLARQMKVVMDACASFGIQTRLSGRNDIVTMEGAKFSGNAFSVKKTVMIQHGTVMIDVNVKDLERYLTPSPLKLKAKGIASVRSRVCSLKQICPSVTAEGMKEALKEAFFREYGAYTRVGEEQLDPEQLKQLELKYSSWEWNVGKAPECEISFEMLLSFGEVQTALHLERMTIKKAAVYSDCLESEYTDRMKEKLQGMRFDKETILREASRLPDGPCREKIRETLVFLAEQI